MANKKTKKDYFAELKALVGDNAELVKFIDHEIELLEKKNASGEKKLTENQKANIGIKGNILNVLVDNGGLMTIGDIQKALGSDFSNQKISALVKQLISDNKVARVEDKRVAYFKAI